MKDQETLKTALVRVLQWQDAHVSFAKAVEGVSPDNIGQTRHALPYSIWQLTEHIRIAQHDMVSFCLDEDYQERQWPDEYWPKEAAPASLSPWQQSLQAIQSDRQRLINAIQEPDVDLFAPIPRGTGQHLFKEAMLIVDHEAYHTGQIVLIRKLLGDWKS